jgi:hypothetical protein
VFFWFKFSIGNSSAQAEICSSSEFHMSVAQYRCGLPLSISHLEEFAGKAHQSRSTTTAATLTLHKHLESHLGRRVDSRLLVSTTSDVALID